MSGRVRASTSVRGYGHLHQARRRALAPFVAAGLTDCARCGEPILPGQAWDLGHVDGTQKRVYSGPEHRYAKDCRAGGNRATSRHRARKPSRPW